MLKFQQASWHAKSATFRLFFDVLLLILCKLPQHRVATQIYRFKMLSHGGTNMHLFTSFAVYGEQKVPSYVPVALFMFLIYSLQRYPWGEATGMLKNDYLTGDFCRCSPIFRFSRPTLFTRRLRTDYVMNAIANLEWNEGMSCKWISPRISYHSIPWFHDSSYFLWHTFKRRNTVLHYNILNENKNMWARLCVCAYV